jgi:hypothetical protein
MDEKITTYKGTDKDMKCWGYQYEIGKTVESDGAIRCGDKGFHSCETPMDVLSYYGPVTGNRYFECEASGKIDKPKPDDGDDSKIASSELKLKAEIGLAGIIKAQIDFVKKWAKGNIAQGNQGHAAAQGYQGHATTQGNRGHAAAQGDWGHAAAQGDWGHAAAQGNQGHATTQGNRGHAAAQGYRGHAAAQGDWGHAAAQGNQGHAAAQGDLGHAEVHGKDAIAAAFGIEGAAMGELGDWIVCAEWELLNDAWHIASVKAAKVDGEKIKPNVWYKLVGGEFVEADQ